MVPASQDSVMLSSMGPPKAYNEELRQSLIAVSAERIAATGIDALSLRSLAAECGTSTTAVYSFFGSKEGLVYEVMQGVVESFVQLQGRVKETDDPIMDLRELGWMYREWAVANPSFYSILVGGFPGERKDSDIRREIATETLRPLRKLVEAAKNVPGTRVSQASTLDVSLSIWGAVHGLLSLENTSGPAVAGEDKDWQELYATQLEMIGVYWFRPFDPDAETTAG